MPLYQFPRLRVHPRCVAVGLISCFTLAFSLSVMNGNALAADAGMAEGMAGWKEAGHGILVQGQTKLQWTQSDNGQDITWEDAKAYCNKMGAGWRLPVVNELTAMYAMAQQAGDSATCGAAMCKASPLFHLSGNWYWSGTPLTKEETDEFDELAWGVLLVNGRKTQALRFVPYSSRALCVHSS